MPVVSGTLVVLTLDVSLLDSDVVDIMVEGASEVAVGISDDGDNISLVKYAVDLINTCVVSKMGLLVSCDGCTIGV